MQLVPYFLIAAGLSSTLALFIALKREIFGNAARQKRRIEQMMTRLEEAARPVEQPAILAPLRAGLNLNKRVHAMRMLRRGEEVSHIAAALGVPRKEVELLIRVHAMGKVRSASAGSAPD
jgi:hypothetical protein